MNLQICHFMCVCSCLRAPWCSLCGGLSWWDSGAERNEVSPNWHRNLCHPLSQEHSWMVRSLHKYYITTVWIIHDVVNCFRFKIQQHEFWWPTYIYFMFTTYHLLSSLLFICLPFLFFLTPLPHTSITSSLQRCVHMDQPPRGGCGAGGIRAGGPGPGGPGHQRCPGGALPHRRGGGGGRPRCHPHQLPRGEATNAPQRRISGWSAGPHICGLQHVKAPGVEQLPLHVAYHTEDSKYRACIWHMHTDAVSMASFERNQDSLFFQLTWVEIWKKCGCITSQQDASQTSHVFLPVTSCLGK